jgi:hypothetical protein
MLNGSRPAPPVGSVGRWYSSSEPETVGGNLAYRQPASARLPKIRVGVRSDHWVASKSVRRPGYYSGTDSNSGKTFTRVGNAC